MKREKTVSDSLRRLAIREKKKRIKWNSLRIMVPGFLGVILFGAILLMLPVCNADGRWLNPVDALFMACTCVCVTGLVTVVPAVQFTLFGKFILLFLIQIGGWGIIVCAVYFLIRMKRKISINARVVLMDHFNLDTMSGMVKMVLYIVKSSLIVEGIGAVCFMFCFIPQYGAARGVWYSIFHSVSAFCNAGVDLLGADSLAQYVKNPWMNFVTMMLIVLGGLGFLVWKDLTKAVKDVVKRKKGLKVVAHRLQLQTKIVLLMTTVLIVGGTVFFFVAEYSNPETLGSLSFGEKWMAALFQSVTTRTAGFFTVSQAGLRGISKFVACLLMLIGGSPVGTAGGMKTATFFICVITCWSILKGRDETECFHRRIADRTVRIAIAIFGMIMTFMFVGTIALCLAEPDVALLDGLYEVSSAVATVGLSAGATSMLGVSGKLIIIVLMYIGRIGPLTLPLLMAAKLGSKNGKRTYPDEHIMVG